MSDVGVARTVRPVPRKAIREGTRETKRVIYHALAPAPGVARVVVNAFRSMLLIAPMNRGKTSWTEAIIGETVQYLVEQEGVDEREIAYVYAEAADISEIVAAMGQSLDFSRLTYIFMFSDDAAASPGQHGRTALSKANVEVSKFYIRIRHILRRKYGYERALTAIHATQVYNLIDKTFREASDIDVIKALPKSMSDRRQILSMVHPAYHASLTAFLRRLGTQRLIAKNLNEFLKSIYTAVVIIDGIPFIVKAYDHETTIQQDVETRKQWLKRIQNTTITGNQENSEQEHNINQNETINTLTHILKRILKNAQATRKGRSIRLHIPQKEIYLIKEYIETLEKLGIQINYRPRGRPPTKQNKENTE